MWLSERTCSELKDHLQNCVPKAMINVAYDSSEMVPIYEALENLILVKYGSIGKGKTIRYHGLTC